VGISLAGLVAVAVGRGLDLVDVSHSVELPWQEEEEPSGRRMRWVSNSVAGVVGVVVEGWKLEWTAWMMQGRVRMRELRKVYERALLGPKLYQSPVALNFRPQVRTNITYLTQRKPFGRASIELTTPRPAEVRIAHRLLSRCWL